jgi:hypothetical protein
MRRAKKTRSVRNLEPHVLNKLRALRGPGESYSDVVLRLVEMEAKGRR